MRNLNLLSLFVIIVATLGGCAAAVMGGAGTAALIAEDRRTLGTVTEDQGIEIKASSRISSRFKDPHVNVTSYNRMVLLTGEAPDAATRSEIERIAQAVENVRGVFNEIAIAGNSSLTARANDSYLTSKVKARFIDQRKFSILHVKVVTESGMVYLLGLVKRDEATHSTEIARTTGGVQKVIKLFEYLD